MRVFDVKMYPPNSWSSRILGQPNATRPKSSAGRGGMLPDEGCGVPPGQGIVAGGTNPPPSVCRGQLATVMAAQALGSL